MSVCGIQQPFQATYRGSLKNDSSIRILGHTYFPTVGEEILMDDALNVILDYRAAVEARVIKALDRFDKESAMHIVMGYMPIVDIEHMADFIERD